MDPGLVQSESQSRRTTIKEGSERLREKFPCCRLSLMLSMTMTRHMQFTIRRMIRHMNFAVPPKTTHGTNLPGMNELSHSDA